MFIVRGFRKFITNLCFRWLMMGIIGFSVWILGFLLHQIIDIISEFKWELISVYIQKQDFPGAFTFTVGYSLIFLVASCMLVLYQPAAAGSGIPEIIGFFNGTRGHFQASDSYKTTISSNLKKHRFVTYKMKPTESTEIFVLYLDKSITNILYYAQSIKLLK